MQNCVEPRASFLLARCGKFLDLQILSQIVFLLASPRLETIIFVIRLVLNNTELTYHLYTRKEVQLLSSGLCVVFCFFNFPGRSSEGRVQIKEKKMSLEPGYSVIHSNSAYPHAQLQISCIFYCVICKFEYSKQFAHFRIFPLFCLFFYCLVQSKRICLF